MSKTSRFTLVLAGLAALTLPAANAVLAQPSPAAADEALPLAPGFWTSHVSAVVLSGNDRRCLRPQDINRYVHGWSNSIYACTYPVSTVGGGHVVWQGTCTSRGGRVLTIDARGTYTQENLHVTGHVGSRLAGVRLRVPFTMDARRLGDCSAFPNEPPPRPRR